MKKVLATAAIGSLMALAIPGIAFAKGGPGVTKAGHCSAASESKLKIKTDDGHIESEFEVDSNVVGQKWKVVLHDNGTLVAHGRATTKAPSGSFEFRSNIADQSGIDVVKAKATNLTTGEVCKATASL